MWKDTIKKNTDDDLASIGYMQSSKKNYHPVYSKSKAWGSLDAVPNELDSYVKHIIDMNDEQRSDVEVQKDIKYIKELCKKKIAQYQEYLNELNDS